MYFRCIYYKCLNIFVNINGLFTECVHLFLKVRGPFVQTLCIEKDSYMDAI